MNPETIKKLRENIPEFLELIAYLTAELSKADSLEGLETLDFKERAYETGVRLRMKERLSAMLAPLVADVDKSLGVNPREYTVDV